MPSPSKTLIVLSIFHILTPISTIPLSDLDSEGYPNDFQIHSYACSGHYWFRGEWLNGKKRYIIDPPYNTNDGRYIQWSTSNYWKCYKPDPGSSFKRCTFSNLFDCNAEISIRYKVIANQSEGWFRRNGTDANNNNYYHNEVGTIPHRAIFYDIYSSEWRVSDKYNRNVIYDVCYTLNFFECEWIQTGKTAKPTNDPTVSPSIDTVTPTNYPTESPTRQPTESPTKQPTKSPTKQPTELPTKQPTESPIKQPTESPTKQPTELPTKQPTESPTKQPTESPTKPPESPTKQPTKSPTKPTESPTKPPESPTKQPTKSPIIAPSNADTKRPTLRVQIPTKPWSSTMFPSYPYTIFTTNTMTESTDIDLAETEHEQLLVYVMISILCCCVLCVACAIFYKSKMDIKSMEAKENELKVASLIMNERPVVQLPQLRERVYSNSKAHQNPDDDDEKVPNEANDDYVVDTNVKSAPFPTAGSVPSNLIGENQSGFKARNRAVTDDGMQIDQRMKQRNKKQREDLKQWLTEIVRLPEYYDVLVQNGYETLGIIKEVKESNELAAIGIVLKGHRLKLMREIERLEVYEYN